MVEDSRLRHVTQFDSLVILRQEEVHALDVSVDDTPRVQMQQAHTDLPRVAPQVLLSEVEPPLELVVHEGLNITAIRQL